MLPPHVDSMVKQLHNGDDRITLMNISEAVMIIPLRIIKKAGVWERCFWEAK